MIVTRIQAKIPLFKHSILTGRAIIAAAPRKRAFISNSASPAYAVNMAGAEASSGKNDTSSVKDELPPLTDHEFKTFNRIADRMELFVSNLTALTHTHVIYHLYTTHMHL